MFNLFKRKGEAKHRLPYTRIASWLLRSSKFVASGICDVLFKENITSKEAFEEGLGDRWLGLCNEIASFHASNEGIRSLEPSHLCILIRANR